MNKIFKNSVFNIIRGVIVTPIYFILVPYIISKIGTEKYGIWALIGTIGSYQTFVNFGLTTSLVRFTAKAKALKDYNAVSEYLATSLDIFFILSTIVAIIIIIFRGFIVVNIFNIKVNIEVATLLIIFSAIASVINMISGLFKSIIDGVQRMDISSGILTVQVILSAIGTFIVLESGYGLTGMGVNLVLVSCFSLLANVIFSKLIVPYRINPLLFSISRLKEMFSYSINIQIGSLIRMWIEPLNKIIISHFFSISYVGYYEIALKFIQKITQLVKSALSPIFPAATELYQKYGVEKIEKLRIKSSKYLFSFTTIIYVVIIILVPDFVKLWLGPELQIVSTVIIIFMIGSYFSLLATSPFMILMGAGYAKDILFLRIQGMVVNIVGILIFIKLYDFYGFCIGFSLSMVYSFLASHYYYKKRFNKELKVYKIFADTKVIISSLIFFAIGFIFANLLNLNNYIIILLLGLILFIFYFGAIWKLRIITRTDIELLLGSKSYSRISNKIRRSFK